MTERARQTHEPSEAASDDKGRGGGALSIFAGVMTGVAVAVALWLLLPKDHQLDPIALGPVPEFAFSTESGDPSAPHRYAMNGEFTWELAPAAEPEAPVDVRVFAFAEDGSGRRVAADSIDGLREVSDAGTVRLAGSVSALGLEPGAWTVVVVVGWEGALPDDAEAVRDEARAKTWDSRRLGLVLEGA